MVNINDLGYSYARGSLNDPDPKDPDSSIPDLKDSKGSKDPLLGEAPLPSFIPTVRVTGANRADVKGSFAIATKLKLDDKEYTVDIEPVLSRWHTSGCANCQTHLKVKTFVNLPALTQAEAETAEFSAGLITRGKSAGGLKGDPPALQVKLGGLKPASTK